MCNLTVFPTDLSDVYLLQQLVHFQPGQTYIKQKLDENQLKISLDFSSRDAYIYKKLRTQMVENSKNLQRQHCIDSEIIKTRLFAIIANDQNSHFKPMRLNDDGRFLLAYSEVIYFFRAENYMLIQCS